MKDPIYLKLYRYEQTEDYTLGKLYHGDRLLCYTIEPPPLGSYPCIPPSTYPIMLNYPSRRFGLVPLVKVPGRTGILLHVGNHVRNTLGCILIGDRIVERNKEPFLCNSKLTFSALNHYLIKLNAPLKIKILIS